MSKKRPQPAPADQAGRTKVLPPETKRSLPATPPPRQARSWEELLVLPGADNGDRLPNTIAHLQDTYGQSLQDDLVSPDREERARAADRLLADSVAKDTIYASIIDRLLDSQLTNWQDKDNRWSWMEQLFAMRERLARNRRESIRLMHALRRPGPVNVQFRADGHQQVNIGSSGSEQEDG